MRNTETKDRRLALMMHAGSGNHGCEAIVRGLVEHLPTDVVPDAPAFRLITNDAAQDLRYLPDGFCAIEEERNIGEHPVAHAFCYGLRKITKNPEVYPRYRFPMFAGTGLPAVAVSIGGDNYCYPDLVPELIETDRMLHRRGTETILAGCSVEPEMLRKDGNMAEDMQSHRLIIARETVTQTALLEAGVDPERLKLLPDPAFSMTREEGALPAGFLPGNTIGLNISPLVEQYRTAEGSALDAYAELIRHMVLHTDLQIALIPHVVWPSSDDRKPLRQLRERFADTGRLILVDDASAPVLKGIIARCRFFIGARTHATIAAYSSLVPTLVVGYSVKSKGIARDLFGTEDEQVLPVDRLTGKTLIDAFEQLRAEEQTRRDRLADIMPAVIEGAKQNAAEIAAVWQAALQDER